MKLIIGLGNPGDRYRFSRHNMGHLTLDELAAEYGISLRRKKFDADIGEGTIGGASVLLVKPRTFMNLSGTAVAKTAAFFKIGIEDMIVVHDDLDLAFGTVRVKEGGGPGGHKGLISLIQHMGGREFIRVRLGIGKPLLKGMVEDYVLQLFSRDEMAVLPEILQRAAEAVTDILASGPQAAMCRFNVRRVKGEKGEEGSCPS